MYAFEYQRAKTVADAAAALAKTGGKALAGGQSLVGAMKLRLANPGTLVDIGGSLANNDPAADYPGAVLALGATVQTNKRKIAADDFFKGMYETALAADEIITAVSFPVPKKAAYVKFPNPASRFALVGVFVAQTGAGVRVAVTGAASHVHRAKAIEDALAKSFNADAAKAAKVDAKGLNNDLHGSAEYRAHL